MTITLPAGLTAETRVLSGWGRTNQETAQVVQPSSIEELQELIRGAPPRSLIARGLGRSYGDAAQLKDGTVIELPAFDRIELDPANGVVTAGAGVSLDQMLRAIVPAGFFLPVTPGTRNVTVGGAIAADVLFRANEVGRRPRDLTRDTARIGGSRAGSKVSTRFQAAAHESHGSSRRGLGLVLPREATFS